MVAGARLAVFVAVSLAVGAVALATPGQAEQDSSIEVPTADLLEMARVGLPPAGTTLKLTAHFPDERPLELGGVSVFALTADVTAEGEAMVTNAITDQEDLDVSATDACNDPAFAPLGVRWSADAIPVMWHFNLRSVPERLSDHGTTRALRKAHQVWPRVRTDCDDDDANDFHFGFKGFSGRRAARRDGYNLIDFGKLGGDALAVNYTWYRGTEIIEVDLRLNKFDYRWTNRPGGKNGYQVMNVATHELGHQLGLDDLTKPHTALTMYGRTARGELKKITLGKGDIKGASALSP